MIWYTMGYYDVLMGYCDVYHVWLHLRVLLYWSQVRLGQYMNINRSEYCQISKIWWRGIKCTLLRNSKISFRSKKLFWMKFQQYLLWFPVGVLFTPISQVLTIITGTDDLAEAFAIYTNVATVFEALLESAPQTI